LILLCSYSCFFSYNDASPTKIYTLSLHDALPISNMKTKRKFYPNLQTKRFFIPEENRWITLKVSTSAIKTINKNGITAVINKFRSEEHTSELQSRENLVCRLLLEKKKT